MSDTYSSVSHLMLVEAQHVSIYSSVHQRSRIAVVAPHAGRIEPVTGELARAIAGDEHRVYCFAGHAPSDNGRLHVTSTCFAEQRLSDVLRGALTVITVHGCRGPSSAMTLLGGLNHSLRRDLRGALQAFGFRVDWAEPPLAGRHPDNLANRAARQGVQIEISRLQRDELRLDSSRYPRPHARDCPCNFCLYVGAIRAAVGEYAAMPDSGASGQKT